MSKHIITPQMGLLREFSPEISPEEKKQLVLDLPPSCSPATHPMAALLRQHWRERVVARRDAALRLGAGQNINKTLRRIDQVLSGERLLPELIERMIECFKIEESEMIAVRQQVEQWQADRDAWGLMVERHRCYHRFGPYLSPLLPQEEVERPQGQAPYESWVEGLYEVHGNPEPEQLMTWLSEREHSWVIGKYAIAGWVYHRSPQEIHYYRADGTHAQSGPAHLPPPAEVLQSRVSKWV